MGSFIAGVLVVMSLGWVGPDLETELAGLRKERMRGVWWPETVFRRAEDRPGRPVVAVTIHRYVVTDAILERLKAYPDLEELTLEDWVGSGVGGPPIPPWRITDAGMAHLKSFKHLRVLSIPTPTITDAGLAYLGAMTQLQELNIGGANITNAGFSHLKNLHQLRSLIINGTRISDPGLEVLKEFTQLRHLRFSMSPGLITEQGLVHLRPLQALQSLEIGDSLRTSESPPVRSPTLLDASLAHLRELPNLELLSVFSLQVTEAGLMHVGAMTRLKELSIGYTDGFRPLHVKAAGLAHLSGLGELRSLKLWIREIDDEGLKQVSKLKRLETLEFSSATFTPRFTDAGLLQLRALTALKSLKLPGGPIPEGARFTQGGIDALRRSLPGLDVQQGRN